MEYKAIHRYGDVTARKVRPFAAVIRGKAADEALEVLRFLPNRGARLVEAVLKSAIGNAGDRGERDPEELIVTEARVDDGPMFKRIMPRARGTAYSILRRMCHVHVSIGQVEEKTKPAGKKATLVQPTAPAAPAPATTEQPATA